MNTANEINDPNTEAVDVLVAGAGPTGLALACALLMHGASVRVIDKAEGPASTSRALILHARGVEVLNRVGALRDLPERSIPALRTTFHVGGRAVAVRFGEVEGASLSALVVSQAEIEAELRRRLAELGGRVEWGTALTDAAQDPDGVSAVLGNGETVSAGWLVGCDGAHSRVRKLAGIGFPGVRITDEWLLADVHADWATDRTGTAGWFTRDGALLAFPLRDVGRADDLWRLIADVSLPDGKELNDEEILDEFRKLLPERAGLQDVRLREAVWTSTFRVHRRLADQYRVGRVLLAGDAAHIHSPIGGQGMNTGIGDAENLAWKLALVIGNRAGEALLNSYEAERRPLAEEVLRGSTAATRLLFGGGPVMRFLLDRVVLPLVEKPRVQRRITFGGSQLGISYRSGPLASRAFPFGRRPRPGDRVPDKECLRTDGTRTRLHTELGGKWAILAPEGSSEALVAMAGKGLGERVTKLVPLEGDPGEVMLVRPDAHLAWRGRPGDAARLGRWLEGALERGKARR